jgi:hypothetical protein
LLEKDSAAAGENHVASQGELALEYYMLIKVLGDGAAKLGKRIRSKVSGDDDILRCINDLNS